MNVRIVQARDRIVRPVVRTTMAIGMACTFVGGLVLGLGLRYVTSPSIPMGVYFTGSYLRRLFHPNAPLPLRRGMTVAGCLPKAVVAFGITRDYLPAGDCPGGAEPIAKVVVAVGGDLVQLSGSTMLVNHHVIPGCGARSTRDPSGRRLVAMRDGRYVLPDGTVWLCGSNPLSWDSRYYGPVDAQAMFDRLGPVWLFWADRQAVSAYNALVRHADFGEKVPAGRR